VRIPDNQPQIVSFELGQSFVSSFYLLLSFFVQVRVLSFNLAFEVFVWRDGRQRERLPAHGTRPNSFHGICMSAAQETSGNIIRTSYTKQVFDIYATKCMAAGRIYWLHKRLIAHRAAQFARQHRLIYLQRRLLSLLLFLLFLVLRIIYLFSMLHAILSGTLLLCYRGRYRCYRCHRSWIERFLLLLIFFLSVSSFRWQDIVISRLYRCVRLCRDRATICRGWVL